MKRSIAVILTFTLLFSILIVPECSVYAKTKCWFGKYCEYKKTAKKSVKIKGNKLYLRRKWERSSSRYSTAKPRKIKRTFKLTKKTKYYIEDTSAETMKRVSKKKFKKNLYNDLSYISFKVKHKKVIKAIVSLN